jgi:disulfide bond formation protein DsbB
MTPLVQNVTDFLSFVILILDIVGVVLLFVLITPLKRRGTGKKIAEFFGERAVLLSFLLAFASVAGSLFYSDVAGFAPCLLCWWQRVFLYPQAILLLTALIKKDEGIRIHSIVLSGIGVLFAIYHTFIQFGGESALPCAATGVSCQKLYFLEYGYITIPTMSLTAFGLILLFMLAPNPLKRDVNEL